MAVNLAKRRFKNLVAKEEFDLENGSNLKKKAQDAIKKNKEELKAHAEEQFKRLIALNSDPRYLGPPITEEVWVGKKIQDKILDKIKKGIIGKKPVAEVGFVPETIESDLSGRQAVIDPSVSDVPAEVAAVNAANSKPVQKANATKAIPQVKEIAKKVKVKDEKKVEEKASIEAKENTIAPKSSEKVADKSIQEKPKSKKSSKNYKKG